MYLGLDLGTSGLKALVLGADQSIVAVANATLEVSRPHPGWSEQDPADWIQACRQVLAELKDYLPQIQGIGIAGHMHGVVLMDEQDQVTRPCLLWNDTRAMSQAQALDATPGFRETTGTIVFPGFNAPKMAWVRDNEPDIWAKSVTMLYPKDYLAWWLTGLKQSEPSDASGSGLFDCEKSVWSKDLCRKAKLPIHMLAPIVLSDGVRRAVRKDLAAEFGFSTECVVAGGAGDNAAAATGIGAVTRGTGQVSLGTSGVLLTVNDRWTPSADVAVHSFAHAVAGSYIQMGVTLTATDSLSWLAEITGKEPGDLAALLPDTPQEPGELAYLPYLAGERTPHNIDQAQGSFIGLSRKHTPKELTQALMEGVAFSIADCAQALEAAGAPIEQLSAVGGGARSDFWLQTVSNVLNRELMITPLAEHAAALGCARLGQAAATGIAVQDLPALASAPSGSFKPQTELVAAYQTAHKRYQELYQAISKVS